jgi:hypothetical protein
MPRSRPSILGDDTGSNYLPENHFGMFPLLVATDVASSERMNAAEDELDWKWKCYE